MIGEVDFQEVFKLSPAPLMVVRADAPTFTIVAVNDAYLAATHTTEADLLNKGLFDAFPGDVNDPNSTASKLRSSLQRVVDCKVPDKLPHLRYDLPEPESGQLQIKYWSPQSSPVFNRNGEVEHILHIALDVTAEVLAEEKEKRAAAELWISQQQYRSLFDHHPDSIVAFDLEGNFIRANPNMARLAECSVTEVLETSFHSLIIPEDLPTVTACFERAIEGEVQNYNTRITTLKGNLRVVNATLIPMYVDGVIVGVYGIGKDITKTREAEEAREASDKLRTLILQSAQDAIVCFDANDVVTVWNEQAERIFGWNADEMIGARFVDYIVPAHRRERHLLDLSDYLATDGSDIFTRSVQVTTIDRNNVEFPIELTIVPVRDGEDEYFCAFIRDITEREHYLTTLNKSEQHFKALVQEGADFISVLDADGCYRYLSPAYQNILGIPSSELIGRSAFNRIHEDDREHLEEAIKDLRASKRMKSMPFRYLDGNGNFRWLEAIGTNLLDDPAVAGIVINSKDITERIKHIRAIEEQNARLRQIAWTQSHIVRAPLSKIMAIADLLGEYPDDTSCRELYTSMLSSAHELDAIVQNIVKETSLIGAEGGAPSLEMQP